MTDYLINEIKTAATALAPSEDSIEYDRQLGEFAFLIQRARECIDAEWRANWAALGAPKKSTEDLLADIGL